MMNIIYFTRARLMATNGCHSFTWMRKIYVGGEEWSTLVQYATALRIKVEVVVEFEIYHLVGNSSNLILKIDHLNARKKLEWSIWTSKG